MAHAPTATWAARPNTQMRINIATLPARRIVWFSIIFLLIPLSHSRRSGGLATDTFFGESGLKGGILLRDSQPSEICWSYGSDSNPLPADVRDCALIERRAPLLR